MKVQVTISFPDGYKRPTQQPAILDTDPHSLGRIIADLLAKSRAEPQEYPVVWEIEAADEVASGAD